MRASLRALSSCRYDGACASDEAGKWAGKHRGTMGQVKQSGGATLQFSFNFLHQSFLQTHLPMYYSNHFLYLIYPAKQDVTIPAAEPKAEKVLNFSGEQREKVMSTASSPNMPCKEVAGRVRIEGGGTQQRACVNIREGLRRMQLHWRREL